MTDKGKETTELGLGITGITKCYSQTCLVVLFMGSTQILPVRSLTEECKKDYRVFKILLFTGTFLFFEQFYGECPQKLSSSQYVFQ